MALRLDELVVVFVPAVGQRVVVVEVTSALSDTETKHNDIRFFSFGQSSGDATRVSGSLNFDGFSKVRCSVTVVFGNSLLLLQLVGVRRHKKTTDTRLWWIFFHNSVHDIGWTILEPAGKQHAHDQKFTHLNWRLHAIVVGRAVFGRTDAAEVGFEQHIGGITVRAHDSDVLVT